MAWHATDSSRENQVKPADVSWQMEGGVEVIKVKVQRSVELRECGVEWTSQLTRGNSGETTRAAVLLGTAGSDSPQ